SYRPELLIIVRFFVSTRRKLHCCRFSRNRINAIAIILPLPICCFYKPPAAPPAIWVSAYLYCLCAWWPIPAHCLIPQNSPIRPEEEGLPEIITACFR